MKKFNVISVNVLNEDKGVLITVGGYQDKIFRSTKQFVAELHSSNILPKNLRDLNHPFVQPILQGLSGGIVFGELDWYTKGSEYEILKDHPSITNKANPKYGDYEIGQMVARETSGFYVERGNMLTLALSVEYRTMQANAMAMAMAPSLDDIFSTPIVKSGSTTATIEELPEVEKIPADLAAAFDKEEPADEIAAPAKKGATKTKAATN